jgi:hypothetical protein
MPILSDNKKLNSSETSGDKDNSLTCLSFFLFFFIIIIIPLVHTVYMPYHYVALVLQSWAVTPEMAAPPYSGSFSSLGQSPVPPLAPLPLAIEAVTATSSFVTMWNSRIQNIS